MRYLAFLCGAGLTLLAQSTNQTAPMPNPYGASTTSARPHTNTPPARLPRSHINQARNGLLGAAFLNMQQTTQEPAAFPTPIKEDPLKDLIISPVYQRDKISPKMIEIP